MGEMSDWRPIETKPKNRPILVTDGRFVTAVLFESDSGYPYGVEFGGYEWEWDFDWRELTHWMPLPEPPK
jgi:hypothetical protein